jgi:hypothetical protein
MKALRVAVILCVSVYAVAASASDAATSLLNADRALAARSHAIVFVAAYSKAMAPDARKLDSGAPPAIGSDSILALMAKYPADLKIDWTPREAVVADAANWDSPGAFSPRPSTTATAGSLRNAENTWTFGIVRVTALGARLPTSVPAILCYHGLDRSSLAGMANQSGFCPFY